MWEEGWWVIQDVAVTPREGRVSRNTFVLENQSDQIDVTPREGRVSRNPLLRWFLQLIHRHAPQSVPGPPRLSASASHHWKNIDGLEHFRFHKSPLMKRIIKDEDRNSGTLEELSMKENTEKLFYASNIQVSLDFEKVKRYRKVWNIIRS